MNLRQALEMIANLRQGETTEDYKKRMAKLRRYENERDFLIDGIEVLSEDDRYADRIAKKKARLDKGEKIIESLK